VQRLHLRAFARLDQALTVDAACDGRYILALDADITKHARAETAQRPLRVTHFAPVSLQVDQALCQRKYATGDADRKATDCLGAQAAAASDVVIRGRSILELTDAIGDGVALIWERPGSNTNDLYWHHVLEKLI